MFKGLPHYVMDPNGSNGSQLVKIHKMGLNGRIVSARSVTGPLGPYCKFMSSDWYQWLPMTQNGFMMESNSSRWVLLDHIGYSG